MSLPEVTSREQWLVARKELLAREKELTRLRDALNADRRRLPMVRIDKEYVFEGPEGRTTLLDLFGEHRQLIAQHFMFAPDWEKGCPSCTAAVDEWCSPGLIGHLAVRSTAFAVVARAPLAKLEAYRAKRGWSVPFYSSHDSDFNYDFHVSFDEAITPLEYNYRNQGELLAAGIDWIKDGAEIGGLSCFVRDGDEVFHTYTTYARGGEAVGGGNYFLDMTALGRQEHWEEPKGRAGVTRDAVPDFAA
jgi:predicted dithiol-disulfide oxidoreductase (DUF899 family)